MGRFRYLISFAVLLLAPGAHAQLWSGILNSGRAVPWESTAGIPGGIPSGSWTQCVTTACNTLTAAGTGATLAQVNSAITSAGPNQYVKLGTGHFTFTGTLRVATNGVVLRGNGPLNTIVSFTGGGTNCGAGQVCGIAIGPTGAYDGSAAVQPGGSNALAITGTTEGGAGVYPWGATHLTVGTVGSDTPVVGTMLMMDQLNDQAVAAGIIVCDNSTVTGGASCSGNGGSFGRGTSAANRRSQTQTTIITNISGSTYTISPGIYFNNVRTGQSPGAWWNFSSSKVTNAGVENLTLDESGPSVGQGITFTNAYQSWVQNVRFVCTSSACPRSHIASIQSLQDEVRNCYLFGAEAGGGAEGYGIEYIESSAFLTENNIFDQNIAPWIQSQITGAVYNLNFSWNNITAASTFMQGSYTSHDTGNGMNLYEMNDINALFADNQHGASSLYDEFRNKLMGNEPVPYNKTSQQTFPVNEDSYNRVGTFVGNVLGSITCSAGTYNGLPADENSQCTGGSATGASYHTVYEASPAVGTTGCNTAIYSFGFGNGDGCNNPGPSGAAAGNDLEVGTSMMRWGNCDTVTNSCRFNSSEVPTAGGTYYIGTSVPASHTLPASFYYSSKPSWYASPYGNPPWPPIGPDVTGGDLATLPSGLAYRIPSRLCFENTAQDSTNYPSTAIKAFDASVCYVSGGLPGAATPTFSPVSGTYSSAQSVTISSSSYTVICYNTTGSPATNGASGCTTGTLYSGPITVAASETLYAAAGGTGFSDSSIGSAAYTITSSPVIGPAVTPFAYSAVPLPTPPTLPALTLTPTQGGSSYVTLSGLSQNGSNWQASEPVRLIGNGFTAASTVTFDTSPLAAVFVSPTEVDVTLPASMVSLPGSTPVAHTFTVTTPAPTPPPAAIVLAQKNSKDAGTMSSTTLAFDSSTIAGNWIGVAVRIGLPSVAALKVSDSAGNTYKMAVQSPQTRDGSIEAIYYAENIKGGADTITVANGSSATLRLAILEYSGIAKSGSLDASAATQSSGVALNSGVAIPAISGDLILAEFLTANSATFTAGSGFKIETTAGGKLMVEDQVQAKAATVTALASIATSDNWAGCVAAFKP